MQYRWNVGGQAGLVIVWLALLAGLVSACSQEPSQEITSTIPSEPSLVAADLPAITAVLNLEPATPTQVPPTATVQTLDACLVGDWIVADLERSMTESYTRAQSPLKMQSVEGQTSYVFRADGSLEIRFNNLITTLSGVIDGQNITARSLLAGTATAQYLLNVANREIVFSNFGGDGIQFATEINGQLLAQGNFPSWRAFSSNLNSGSPSVPTAGPTRVVEKSYAAVTCAGDEMRLQAIDPIPGPEVKLSRSN